MPEFTYIARDHSGEKVSGSLTADGQREAMALLSTQSLFPIEVQVESGSEKPTRVRRVPPQLMATTYGQMADLLRSGVPLLRSLAVLQRQTSHVGLSFVLEEIHRYVEDGATLAEAMNRFPRVFSEMAVSMVRAGGEGGFMEEALTRVAEFTEAQEDLKKRTVGAMVYPMVLAAVGTIIVTILVVFFVPMFASLFETLREQGQLPMVTEWLLWVSDVVGGIWGLLIFLAAVGGGFYAKWWLSTEAGISWWHRTKIRLPIVGPIFLSLAVARFCRVLGTLLGNGVSILRALDISSTATANRELTVAIRAATENISAGESLAEPLGASGKFPPTVVEMIAVAEQANTLETVLLGIADSLERHTWRRLDLAVRLIEPLLLMVLASAVLVVVVALLLPLMRMSLTVTG